MSVAASMEEPPVPVKCMLAVSSAADGAKQSDLLATTSTYCAHCQQRRRLGGESTEVHDAYPTALNYNL